MYGNAPIIVGQEILFDEIFSRTDIIFSEMKEMPKYKFTTEIKSQNAIVYEFDVVQVLTKIP